MSRGTMFTGPRMAMCEPAPCSHKSIAISPPELPKPTTRTSVPTKRLAVAVAGAEQDTAAVDVLPGLDQARGHGQPGGAGADNGRIVDEE